LVGGGEVVIPPKMRGSRQVGVHPLTELLNPEIVDVSGEAGEGLGSLGGQRNVLPDVVGARRPEAWQRGDKLPDIGRALAKGVRAARGPLQRRQRERETGPSFQNLPPSKSAYR
jgi:hypothetical protein